jgi:hypothetical protein
VPALQRRAVHRALAGKLRGEERPGKDHKTCRFTLSDGRWRETKISHGRAHDIPASLVSTMAKQLTVTPRQFRDAVDCTLSREDFWAQLEQAPR